MSLLSAPGFYTLLEFAYLSRLPTRRLSVWVNALQACWPRRRKSAVSSGGVVVTPTLKPTYISDWRKSVLRSSWLAADKTASVDNETKFHLDFRINHYELRCQHWAGESPNALMLVIFERNTETLCHEFIKLSHIQKGRLDRLIADRIKVLAIQMLDVLEISTAAVRFNFPSGKRQPNLYLMAENTLQTQLPPNVQVTIEHYRSRAPLKFRAALGDPSKERPSPRLKKERIARRHKLHLDLYRFSDAGVSEFANFWRSLSVKMNESFKDSPGDLAFIPCWIDLTKRSVFESEFTGYTPKKKSKQAGIELHRLHDDYSRSIS